MARQTSKSQTRQAPAKAQKNAPKRRLSQDARQGVGEQILDDHRRRDILGIVFIIIAIVLMLVVVLPSSSGSDALVTGVAGTGLHLAFGVGCYILPVFLAIYGVTFFIHFEHARVSANVAIGLCIIYIALLGFIALFTPVTNIGSTNLSLLFTEQALTSHGGYVGAALAWCGLKLFGQIISGVILAGLMLVGIIFIGFSLSKFIEKVVEIRKDRKMRSASDSADAPMFARIQRGRAGEGADDAAGLQGEYENAQGAMAPLGAETSVFDDSAYEPAADKTIQMQHADNGGRKNMRHRGSRTFDDNRTSVLTQKIGSDGPFEPIDYPDSNTDDGYFDDDTQMGETIAMPMTRKLGKHRKEDESSETGREVHISETERSNALETPVAEPNPQEGFVLPPMSLLTTPSANSRGKTTKSELDDTAARLQETLEEFGIMADVVRGIPGPTVTLFLVDLPPGVRVSRVTALTDDIALALAAPGVRIFAPVPNTNYVGIEVPNQTREMVLLSEVLAHADKDAGPLTIAIGKDVEGNSIISDLAKMPHLLIGGTTGSGKSVAINAMIMSILMRATPSEVRFILIDPKRVEFTPYNGIPHLYVPVVTEAREAASALAWGVAEMERRLKVFSKAGARNIGQFNAKVKQARAEEEKAHETQEEIEPWEYGDELPYIVIVIDELSDLMMNVGKEVENSISRIAQLARAAGIHLIVATQRPSTNVVTGLIKANITNRIAFNVASGIDSRVILDTPGAENLIGLGDMLFAKPEFAKPQRIQGCYVSEEEINAVVSMLKEQGEPDYHSEILTTNIAAIGSSAADGSEGKSSGDDPLVWEAAEIVASSGLGSTSNIQRRLKVGYSRAGRIMDQLEDKGIVGPANGSKPREVLVDPVELETLKAFEANDETLDSSDLEE